MKQKTGSPKYSTTKHDDRIIKATYDGKHDGTHVTASLTKGFKSEFSAGSKFSYAYSASVDYKLGVSVSNALSGDIKASWGPVVMESVGPTALGVKIEGLQTTITTPIGGGKVAADEKIEAAKSVTLSVNPAKGIDLTAGKAFAGTVQGVLAVLGFSAGVAAAVYLDTDDEDTLEKQLADSDKFAKGTGSIGAIIGGAALIYGAAMLVRAAFRPATDYLTPEFQLTPFGIYIKANPTTWMIMNPTGVMTSGAKITNMGMVTDMPTPLPATVSTA